MSMKLGRRRRMLAAGAALANPSSAQAALLAQIQGVANQLYDHHNPLRCQQAYETAMNVPGMTQADVAMVAAQMLALALNMTAEEHRPIVGAAIALHQTNLLSDMDKLAGEPAGQG